VTTVLTVGVIAWTTPAGANDPAVVRTVGGLVRSTVGTDFRASSPRWPRYAPVTDQFQSLAPEATAPVATFAADHNCALWASLT